MKPLTGICLISMLSWSINISAQEQTLTSDQLERLVTETFEFGEFIQISDDLDPGVATLLGRSLRIDPRIVGGIAAYITDYPWQVALVRGYAPEPSRSQFCGGTLTRADLVVTAAHCLDNSIVRNDPSRVNIIAGTAFYPSGGERIAVTELHVHPKWDSNTMDYDVAVLVLDRESTLGNPIPLDSVQATPGTQSWVSGWGAQFEGGSGSPDLLAADVPIISNSACNTSEIYNGEITTRMLCAGLRAGGVDSCQGDSGGPLVIGRPDDSRLVGIVSWGIGCARAGKYGVYTRVSEVFPWLSSF